MLLAIAFFQNFRSSAKAAPQKGSRAEALHSQHTNRLIQEKSPYLLQHAHNPVDWYPWGEEAFAKARKESKPIFLSVGYSTCHWCHVMERESFENPEIARILNEHFVSIKVDREERPDVDRVYMTFVQTTTGRGGWPMSVWLTPDLKPFVGGAYYPPEDREGLPGLRSILLRITELWEKNREQLVGQAEEVMTSLRGYATRSSTNEAVGLGNELGVFGDAAPKTWPFGQLKTNSLSQHEKHFLQVLRLSAYSLRRLPHWPPALTKLWAALAARPNFHNRSTSIFSFVFTLVRARLRKSPRTPCR